MVTGPSGADPSPTLPAVSRNQGPTVKWSQYLAFRAAVGLSYLLGVRVCLLIAAGVGRVLFLFDRRHRRRALDHVRFAFPHWDDGRVTRVARRSYQRLAQLAVEMLFMPRLIRAENYEAHLVRIDELGALELFRAREPMLLLTGHFGNWEAIPYFLSLEGHAIAATVRPLDNVLINDWLLGIRRTHGVNVIAKWDRAERRIVEERVVRRPTRFPYVPGLLSFREAPALAAVFRKLRSEPDAFMFDGQGYAHPRRFGLACHMGVLLDRPAFGCAKSVLVGDFDLLGKAQWSTAPLIHDGEQVGFAVRTRPGVQPVFLSVGHRMSLRSAVALPRMCTTRYRIPEPTRRADALVARVKRGI